MPPKSTHSRGEVVQAALALVDKQGLYSLTARGVAAALGCSTAPVYRYFANMKDLEGEVVRRIIDRIREGCCRSCTESVFLDMGVGFAIYARDHPNLWRAVFLDSRDYADQGDRLFAELLPRLELDPRTACLPEEKRAGLLRKMGIVTHGLATMICVGFLKDSSDESIVGTLRMLGRPVIGEALAEAQGQAPAELTWPGKEGKRQP